MTKEKKNLLVFGYGLVVIMAWISFRQWHHHGWGLIHAILFPLMSFFLYITLQRQELLKAIYIRWMKVAHFIGNIVTTLIMSILFYFVFGIVGIILRLMRKDFLDRSIDKNCSSYWIQREKKVFDPQTCRQQF